MSAPLSSNYPRSGRSQSPALANAERASRQWIKEAERLRARVKELELALEQAQSCLLGETPEVVGEGYAHDKKDQWSDDIAAAHPTITGKHWAYEMAMELVGNRHSKRSLVEMVTWLVSTGFVNVSVGSKDSGDE